MALDSKYFDGLSFELIKRRYYEAYHVDAALMDIKRQAEAMQRELDARDTEISYLRTQLSDADKKKIEIGTAYLSAQTVYDEIVDKANFEAENLVRSAREESEAIIRQARERQEYAVQSAQEFYAAIRERYVDGLDNLNARWQEFLCKLPEEPGKLPDYAQPEKEKRSEPALADEDDDEELSDEEAFEREFSLPDDIDSKLSRIVDELRAIEGGLPDIPTAK